MPGVMGNHMGVTASRRPLPELTVRLPNYPGNCYGQGDVMYPPEPRKKGRAYPDPDDVRVRRPKLAEIAKNVCVGCQIRGWCSPASRFEEVGVWAHRTVEDREARLGTDEKGKPRGFPTRMDQQLRALVDAFPEREPLALAREWEIGATPEAGAKQIQRLRKELRRL